MTSSAEHRRLNPGSSGGQTPFAQCTRGSDINADRDCRFVAYTNSIQDYWSGALQDYQPIKVGNFRRAR